MADTRSRRRSDTSRRPCTDHADIEHESSDLAKQLFAEARRTYLCTPFGRFRLTDCWQASLRVADCLGMSRSPRDPIAFVEACYDLGAPEQQWMQQIADIGQPLLKVKTLLAYHVNSTDQGFEVRCPVQAGDAEHDVVSRIVARNDLFERQRKGKLSLRERLEVEIWNKVTHAGLMESVDKLLLSKRQTLGPRWAYTLGCPVCASFCS